MRRTILYITAVLFLLIAAGCVNSTPEAEPRDLHVAALANPINLNPLFLRDAVSAEAATLLHAPLVTTDPETLEPKPRLFASWEKKGDNLVYEFTLHEDVFWSDGTPLTAKDVAFTLRAISHPDYTGWMFPLMQYIAGAEEYRQEHEGEYADGEIEGITVVDDLTLKIELKQAHAPFLTYLTFAPLPSHVLAKTRVSELEEHPYSRTAEPGVGPYLLEKWRQDEYLHVRANPDYFLGEPQIKNIYYRVITNPEAQLIELLAGKLDMIPTAVKVEDIHTLATDQEIRIQQNPRLVYDYIGMNISDEDSVLSDKKVRTALSMLLDKEGLVENLLLGYGEPLHGPLLPLHFAYDEEFTVFEENLPAARNLLVESGNGSLDLTLIVNAGNVVRENAALIFKEQAAKIGVDVTVKLLEWEAFLAAYREGDYDLVALGRGADADPDLTFHWHSESAGNTLGYKNEKVDQLLEEGAAAVDKESRSEIYRRAQQIIVEDAPIIWLYSRQAVHAVSKDLTSFTPHPEMLFYNVHEWHWPMREDD
ncbi:peptide-binding protein [Dethiobacter alkaliphilus]|uniref:Extracellular solute-binding protein family 5 n=1 Tax=Dethiobacter alkaliphilus AHT 1 TaxID=555088 RepID=C0GIS3_DETAL|nr:peptide-binding protein [Dethiobacter alkaliphilus]EEG76737.1 extracellular solute-binding protein family 5 [Dethiobacter alkaliphilus AHT 1]